VGTVFVLATAAAAVSASAPQSPNLSGDRLIAAGAAYVERYQEDFAFLLADEFAAQTVTAVPPEASGAPARRTTRAEVFITFLPGRRHWTIVRDVIEIDGAPAADRADVPALLAREEPDALARRLFALNSRYNIGRVVRTFNDPMLGLLALNRSHRPRFSLDVAAIDRSDPAAMLATIRFRERERPTLVRSTTNASVFATGDIVLDAASGVVRKTRVLFRHDGIDAELVTEFDREPRLGLWVPMRFTEHYTAARDGRRDETRVASSYTNYRRFDVRGRLLQ
jgi:hypothetical protein